MLQQSSYVINFYLAILSYLNYNGQKKGWRSRPKKIATSLKKQRKLFLPSSNRLCVVVERELVRMRTQTHGVDFGVEFVRNPVVDEVFGKDSPFG